MIRCLFLLILFASWPLACRRSSREVVVYVSVDQPHAEPILKAFEKESGIRTRAVFDVEAVKSVGLANRILEERSHPKADVFWNGEILQTLRLEREGALESYTSPAAQALPRSYRPHSACWTGLGGRGRVFLVNTHRMPSGAYPRQLNDLLVHNLSAKSRGLALPLFGTTLTHGAALYARWGPEKTRAFFRELRKQDVRFFEGNASVRDAVVRGEITMGLTDTDDAVGALARKAPVAISGVEGDGALVIPSSVALLKGAPHGREGRMLLDFLASTGTEEALIHSGFWQIAPRKKPGSPVPETDWYRVMDEYPRAARELRELFH